MAVEPARNSFRQGVLSGEKRQLVVKDKAPRLEREELDYEALDAAMVSRAEGRRGDHREQDRHRLSAERATVAYEGASHRVELVNLSAGGAMIRCDFAPRLWDVVELRLGDAPPIEAAVRWLKDGNVGLEFAHETRIDCAPEQRAALLLEVIQRSFPESRIELESIATPEEEQARTEQELGARSEIRHPLVWKGSIHFAFDTNPVRLRNISTGGALLDVMVDYPVGSDVMFDLGEAGQIDSTVTWAHGDQIGLRFNKPFDLDCLAKLRPDLTPYRWTPPTFLDRAENEESPWNENWSRSSISELRSELEGFLKR